jgi:hypothetical protein
MMRLSNTARLWRHDPAVLVIRPWHFGQVYRCEFAEVAVTALMEGTNAGGGVEGQPGPSANCTMKSIHDAGRRDQRHPSETSITSTTERLDSELNAERRTV